MKFALIVCYETDLGRVIREVEAAGAPSYTFLRRISGRGETGAHVGTESAMGFNSAILVGCDDGMADRVRERLAALRGKRVKGLHAFCWDAEQWL